ncbi:MAG TPA: saccharopine dehydrogenase NADP-binding domain-containing protein [Polyangiaceae bacterium]|nr:saccharopine dehydrogenase NADP-binding domain-containing protein [Polyangiaceae bacterium]
MESKANGGSPRRLRDRSRPHDVVLFGATGFTGELVAEYLAEHYGDSDLRLALAGRSKAKLEKVRERLGRIRPSYAELPILIADSYDRASLDRVAADASVVCTTVGPYDKYGAELVAACVEHATDYCDLTGETQFIRRMIDAHHARAEETGARIVHCCGFDSIPSDLGSLMLQDHAFEKHGAPCSEIKFFAGKTRGGFSGGTVASMFNVVDEVKRDRSVLKVLGHPYALNPEGERKGPDGSDQRGVRYDADIGAWTAPFIMAAINTRIVRRSNALLGFRYGRDFRYSEVMSLFPGAKGLAMAAGVAAGLTGFMLAGAVGPTRSLLEKKLPKPGEGPSREERERGFFEIHLLGSGVAKDGKPFKLRGRVVGTSDPGYGETAKMLGESAVCLAQDGAELSRGGGILTPATAMGATLTQRLRKAGMTFELVD